VTRLAASTSQKGQDRKGRYDEYVQEDQITYPNVIAAYLIGTNKKEYPYRYTFYHYKCPDYVLQKASFPHVTASQLDPHMKSALNRILHGA